MTNLQLFEINGQIFIFISSMGITLAFLVYYGIKALKSPTKENFYLLSARLITAAENSRTFNELDNVKSEFYSVFKLYSGHEDFKDAYANVNGAIRKRSMELHRDEFYKSYSKSEE